MEKREDVPSRSPSRVCPHHLAGVLVRTSWFLVLWFGLTAPTPPVKTPRTWFLRWPSRFSRTLPSAGLSGRLPGTQDRIHEACECSCYEVLHWRSLPFPARGRSLKGKNMVPRNRSWCNKLNTWVSQPVGCFPLLFLLLHLHPPCLNLLLVCFDTTLLSNRPRSPGNTQDWYIGITPASQAGEAGSTPVSCSRPGCRSITCQSTERATRAKAQIPHKLWAKEFCAAGETRQHEGIRSS